MTNKHDLPSYSPGGLYQIYGPLIPEVVQAAILFHALKYGSPRPGEWSDYIKDGLDAYQILKEEMEKIDLGGTKTSATEKE